MYPMGKEQMRRKIKTSEYLYITGLYKNSLHPGPILSLPGPERRKCIICISSFTI